MTAGLDERLAADEETRSFDDLLIDRALEADVGAAEVADRGEPAQKHLLHDPRRVQRDERIGQSRVVGRVGQRRDDMGVAVDEAGHQGLAAQVDAVGGGILDRLVRNLLDEPVGDADEAIVLPFVARAVENARVFEDRRLHGPSGSSGTKPHVMA
jgi:hypothetical protein